MILYYSIASPPLPSWLLLEAPTTRRLALGLEQAAYVGQDVCDIFPA